MLDALGDQVIDGNERKGENRYQTQDEFAKDSRGQALIMALGSLQFDEYESLGLAAYRSCSERSRGVGWANGLAEVRGRLLVAIENSRD